MKGSFLLPPIARRLEGKVALITGAASGIGESAARLFVKHGAKVVIADIQDELGRSVCHDIGSGHQQDVVSYVNCDVSKETDVENAVNMTVRNYGKLDIMFSNAGFGGRKMDTRISSIDYDEYRRVFDVNVFGALVAAKHAARVMIPAKAGSILFTSSAASVTYGDVAHPYLASKNAVVGLSKNVGVELGQYGIRVNCISPYGVATPMLLRGMGGLDKDKAEQFFCEAANLKGTVLKTEDIANAALYLASDDSKYVSGTNLVVDGGYSTTNISLAMAVQKLLISSDN